MKRLFPRDFCKAAHSCKSCRVGRFTTRFCSQQLQPGRVGGNVSTDVSTRRKSALHIPVMAQEVVDIMQPQPGQRYMDMTFGAGGHTRRLLQCQPDLHIYALDRDPEAHQVAMEMANKCTSVVPLLGRFSELSGMMGSHGLTENSLDGVLFDVGASSMQFDSESRGFALSKMNSRLDMRMDKDRLPHQPSAADVVNNLSEEHLCEIIETYGQEKQASEVAKAIVEHREHLGQIHTTAQLAEIVSSVLKGSYRKNKLNRNAHVGTRIFQALRIYVNDELNELYLGLETVHRLLKPGGMCVVIVFHSLEERVVKRLFLNRTGPDKDRKQYQVIHGIVEKDRENYELNHRGEGTISHHELLIHGQCDGGKHRQRELLTVKQQWKTLSKKALGPSEQEIYRNPRARSARIRAAEKV